MKAYASIDYDYRPGSYWEEEDVLATLLRNVKGTQRREMIREHFLDGRIEELENELANNKLTEEVRDALGKIHPVFMGGEYLPDYLTGETKIARIELRSTTGDVISIRARRCGGKRISYRIVDEYGTEFRQGRQESNRPLTLRQLIRLIDESEPPDLSGGAGAVLQRDERGRCRARGE